MKYTLPGSDEDGWDLWQVCQGQEACHRGSIGWALACRRGCRGRSRLCKDNPEDWAPRDTHLSIVLRVVRHGYETVRVLFESLEWCLESMRERKRERGRLEGRGT